MAQSRADRAIIEEANKLIAEINERMDRTKKTFQELLESDPYLCGRASFMNKLFVHHDLDHLASRMTELNED